MNNNAIEQPKDHQNYYKEIEVYRNGLDKKAFDDYLNKLYKAFIGMRPGETIVLEKDVDPNNHEKFINIGCLYISEGNTDYIFSNDYTIFKRLAEHPEKSVAAFYEQLAKKKKQKIENDDSKNNGNE